MQEDKEAGFDAAETLHRTIAAMAGMVRRHDRQRGRYEEGGRRRLLDRDRPGRLVGARGGGCRSARPITSPAARWRWPRRRSSPLEKLSLEELQTINGAITGDVYSVLSVQNSVKSRASFRRHRSGSCAAGIILPLAKSVWRRFDFQGCIGR